MRRGRRCVPQSQQTLVTEISNFVVMERNGAMIGCAALQLFEEEETAEVYAFAVAPG